MILSSHPGDGAIRVLVVDGDRRVRRSLSGLIDLADGLTCCGAVGSGTSAVSRLVQEGADVCLIDPHLPEVDNGVALLAELRARWPRMGIVAMSCADANEDPCLDGGADAFVAKSGQPDALVEALRAVAASHSRGTDDRIDR